MGDQERLLVLLLEAARIYCNTTKQTMERLEHIETALSALTETGKSRRDTSPLRALQDDSAQDVRLDPLFVDVMDLFADNQSASVSLVQRRFRVGYSRASRIVDQLEQQSLVDPFAGSKPREVLVTNAEWQMARPHFVPAEIQEDNAYGGAL